MHESVTRCLCKSLVNVGFYGNFKAENWAKWDTPFM
jgi:hypothetical protein